MKIKVPSLQHLARNWRSDAQLTKKNLVSLAKHPPTFNYNPLFGAVRDMLVFAQPYDEIIKGMRRFVKRSDVLENFLGVLPLIRDHFSDVTPTYVQQVERRYYPAGRGLMVPFDPPMVYGALGEIQFPWFSFWRSNPLSQERLSLFVSLVDDVLHQDPDLEDAKFSILDFSAPIPGEDRELKVLNANDIERLSEKRKREMLDIFAEGYFLAVVDLSNHRDQETTTDQPQANDGQSDLFDKD